MSDQPTHIRRLVALLRILETRKLTDKQQISHRFDQDSGSSSKSAKPVKPANPSNSLKPSKSSQPPQLPTISNHNHPSLPSSPQWLKKYRNVEDNILSTLEVVISHFDHLILIQSFIPRLRDPSSKLGRILSNLIRFFSKVYLVVIAINCRRLLVRLIRINKLTRALELQCRIFDCRAVLDGSRLRVPPALKNCLVKLYEMKLKIVLKLVGCAGELMLSLDMLWKRFRLPGWLRKIVSVLNWIINIYRYYEDEDEDAKEDLALSEMASRYT